MRKLTMIISASLLALASPAFAQAAKTRPNILVIVADDLGFSDIGAFGGEIETPNLDALARDGVKLTDFHTAPTCSPTRAMLLSGTDSHRAGLGTMAGYVSPNQRGRPGYEGVLRQDVASLAERLVASGYRTYFSGKWHLGSTPETDPYARGFQHSFALLQGSHNHFGNDVSAEPLRPGGPSGRNYSENGKLLPHLPANFYSSDAFAGKLIEQLEAPHEKRPFFAYLAFTAPHSPLQAPPEVIAKYKGRYDMGYEQLRLVRLERQRALGILPASTTIHDFQGKKWAELTDAERQDQSRKMEVYAAMIDRLDQNVGRVISTLKASGEYENTVIVFLSDNGAEGLDFATTTNPAFRQSAAGADNSLDNLGRASSYAGIGIGWAQAASAASWMYKGYATEGGTRTPAIIAGPGVTRSARNAPAYTHVMDVLPTVLDLAGIPVASSVGGKPVQPVLGQSWVPLLRGTASTVYSSDQAIGIELFGSRAIRKGDWKITRRTDAEDWRLFNIARDPGETRDLSAQEPARRADLLKAWDDYAKSSGVIIADVMPDVGL